MRWDLLLERVGLFVAVTFWPWFKARILAALPEDERKLAAEEMDAALIKKQESGDAKAFADSIRKYRRVSGSMRNPPLP